MRVSPARPPTSESEVSAREPLSASAASPRASEGGGAGPVRQLQLTEPGLCRTTVSSRLSVPVGTGPESPCSQLGNVPPAGNVPRSPRSWRVNGDDGARCLNVTCVQCENGKSISPIDSAQPTMAHDADTDSDLARPPDGKHPSARHATPAMLPLSATRRRTAGHVVAHSGPSDLE